MTYIVYKLDLQLLAYLCCSPTSFACQLHTYYVCYLFQILRNFNSTDVLIVL